MIHSDFLAKLLGFWFFYRFHPQIALRYLPFVDVIKKLPKSCQILEVGSGGLGICPYLKREVTGVDLKFSPPYHPMLKKVKGSALTLPFDDCSFDVVLSVDMLEHIKPDDRGKAVSEMIRCARKLVLIGVPCGEEAHRQDILINNYYIKKYGKSYPFLKEQVSFGLPYKEEIRDKIVETANRLDRKVKIVKSFGNVNLGLRLFLMKGWMSKNLLVDIFFRKILILAVPLMKLLNQEPTYRKMFVIEVSKMVKEPQ